jgi:HlyD family secretion protein
MPGIVALMASLLAGCSAKPPLVSTAKVARETIVSTLVTNGKVEPAEWQAVRAERDGLLREVLVQQGQAVARSQVIARISAPGDNAELSSAEAREADAAAALLSLERGGSPQALAEIDAQIRTAQQEKDQAQRELATLDRLVEKGAAPKAERDAVQNRIAAADTAIAGLRSRRQSLGGTWENRAAAEARVAEAQQAVALAKSKASLSEVRAPLAGTVYKLDLRQGAYVHGGDLIAEIGQVSMLKAHLYVDEPELGRVSKGLAVQVTWDAVPGRTWMGEVEKLATQIVTIGNRQVGEVICRLDNADGRLPPGANINVEITSQTVQNALAIPKEALRREKGKSGVFVVEGGKLAWRDVTVGTSSITRAEVRGLKEGDTVVLPGEVTLTAGMDVRTE